jgi:dehydrogenase/reductase SDR family member 12
MPQRLLRCASDSAPTVRRAKSAFLVADTGNLDTVRGVCNELADRHEAIHALIHNAGALDKEYAVSPQGIERTVAGQVVGPFLMTGLLLPLLRSRPGSAGAVGVLGRHVHPATIGHRPRQRTRWLSRRGRVLRAKRAPVTLAQMWAERLRPDRITVHAMHPGWFGRHTRR